MKLIARAWEGVVTLKWGSSRYESPGSDDPGRGMRPRNTSLDVYSPTRRTINASGEC